MTLNFPKYPLKTITQNGKVSLWDIIRKKYIIATPEEWVRQYLVHFLIHERQYPKAALAVEKGLYVNTLQKRPDLVAYNKMGHPALIAECKAPHIKLTQNVFDQVSRYNIALKVDYLLVTNGLQHYCCKVDLVSGEYEFLADLPFYETIIEQ